jgi:murein DD-endopeptidase MepM/ murein hydrolase activator NlpD
LVDPTRAYLYAHLSDREPAGFYCVGNTIGKTGTSGNASSNRPHLHLQLQINGANADPGSDFSEPTNVIEATGSSATVIDKTLPEPCAQCAM